MAGVPNSAEVTYATTKDGPYRIEKTTRTDVGITTIYYKIKKENYNALIGSVKIKIIADSIEDKIVLLSYTSTVYNDTVKKPVVTIKGLTQGVDYSVDYKNNINIGKAYILISGIGNYIGKIEKTFIITPSPSSNVTAKLEYAKKLYTGNVQTPVVTVVDNNQKKLLKDKDYLLSYAKGRVLTGNIK